MKKYYSLYIKSLPKYKQKIFFNIVKPIDTNKKNELNRIFNTIKPIDIERIGERNRIYNTKNFNFDRLLRKTNISDIIAKYDQSHLPLKFYDDISIEEASNDIIHIFHHICNRNLVDDVVTLVEKYPQLISNKKFLYDGIWHATMYNSTKILKYLDKYATQKMIDNAYGIYYTFNNTETFTYFMNRGVNIYDGYNRAIYSGYHEAFDLLVKNSDPKMISQSVFDDIVFKFACNDNVDMLKYVFGWAKFTVSYGWIIQRNIANMKYPYENLPKVTMYLLHLITNNDNNASLNKLIELNQVHLNGISGLTSDTSLIVLEKGECIVKDLILKGGMTDDPRLLRDYASMGNFKMVKWLIDHGINPINQSALEQAQLSKDVYKQKIIDLLVSKGNKITEINGVNPYELRRIREEEQRDAFYY